MTVGVGGVPVTVGVGEGVDVGGVPVMVGVGVFVGVGVRVGVLVGWPCVIAVTVRLSEP